MGPFLLRDYSNDDTDDLKGLRGLLEQIQTRHKLLIPGSMNRLIRQWEGRLAHGAERTSRVMVEVYVAGTAFAGTATHQPTGAAPGSPTVIDPRPVAADVS